MERSERCQQIIDEACQECGHYHHLWYDFRGRYIGFDSCDECRCANYTPKRCGDEEKQHWGTKTVEPFCLLCEKDTPPGQRARFSHSYLAPELEEVQVCETCGGKGRLQNDLGHRHSSAHYDVPCPDCKPCETCGGRGEVSLERDDGVMIDALCPAGCIEGKVRA